MAYVYTDFLAHDQLCLDCFRKFLEIIIEFTIKNKIALHIMAYSTEQKYEN